MFKRTSLVKFFILVVILMSVFLAFNVASAKEVTIKAGTVVPVKIDETLSSEDTTTGQSVRFTVTRDIVVDGYVVIKAGSEVVGEVTHSQKTGSLGKEGQLYITVRYATAVDNTRVPLRAKLSETGDEQVALSWMVCPFIKGTSSTVRAGTSTKAYVDYDTKVNAEEMK